MIFKNFKLKRAMHAQKNTAQKNTAQHEHAAHYFYISYQKPQCYHFYYFFTDFSHFMETRLRYPNRAVIYSTAVRKCRYTLIKQSALEHNFDFEGIILSIIVWTFEHC